MLMKNSETPIYLDHNATTRVDQEVAKAMMPYLEEEFGNPSSGYLLGIRAKEGLEGARKEVTLLLGCQNQEIVFTSGGSESNNMVLKGLIDFMRPEKFHIITSAVEHPAILNPAFFLWSWESRLQSFLWTISAVLILRQLKRRFCRTLH